MSDSEDLSGGGRAAEDDASSWSQGAREKASDGARASSASPASSRVLPDEAWVAELIRIEAADARERERERERGGLGARSEADAEADDDAAGWTSASSWTDDAEGRSEGARRRRRLSNIVVERFLFRGGKGFVSSCSSSSSSSSSKSSSESSSRVSV